MKANILHHIVAKWAVLRAPSAKEAWERAVFQENWGVFNSLYLTQVSAQGVDGWSMFRAYDASSAALRMLMERGADPHVQYGNNYNDHLIQRAAVQGDISTVQDILSKGGNLQVRCFNQYDVLGAVVMGWGDTVASLTDRRCMVQFLLDQGANAQSLQGSSQRSLLDNNDVDFEITAKLVKAGAPLQWSASYHDHTGTEITQTAHLFHRIFQKSSHELCITDIHQWMQLLKTHGALDDLTPDWNNGHPLSHVILSSNLNADHYINVIEKHLGPIDQLSKTGENIWHTLFAQPAYIIEHHKDTLLARDKVKALLYTPNNQGTLPRDVLQQAMQKHDVNPKELELFETFDRELFQRPVLLEAAGFDAAPLKRRLKL